MPETRKKTKPKTEAIVTVLAAPEEAPPKPKIGRPSKYTPELAQEICQRLSEGEPLRQICRDDHMPAWQKIYEWMVKDAELSGAIARAREVGQDAMAERAYLEMYQEPERILSEGGGKIDPGHVQLVKARAEITLKLLAKWNPKRYGDRVELAGDKENPLQINAQIETKSLFSTILNNLELKKQV
jgi:hypothetical protein